MSHREPEFTARCTVPIPVYTVWDVREQRVKGQGRARLPASKYNPARLPLIPISNVFSSVRECSIPSVCREDHLFKCNRRAISNVRPGTDKRCSLQCDQSTIHDQVGFKDRAKLCFVNSRTSSYDVTDLRAYLEGVGSSGTGLPSLTDAVHNSQRSAVAVSP